MFKILTIIGARPQFIKAAVVSKAFSQFGIKEEIIHTGQHYDHNMSTVFWEELEIPTPNINLQIGSNSHGIQTGEMMKKIESYILSLSNLPDGLLVYGDTNSTLAGAIVASKLHIPVIHIESGLRSFNKEMPEEINRIMTDHVSQLLFCSSEAGVNQLKKENITNGVHNVGDVMYDAVLSFLKIAENKIELNHLTKYESNEFNIATIHRPSNTDSKRNILSILDAFKDIQKPIIWPLHPRNKEMLKKYSIPNNVTITEPLSYFEMLILLKNSNKVFTDSGGLQKEAYWLKKPCITLRKETEWTETLDGNWNILVDSNTSKIINAFSEKPTTKWKPLYGNGTSASQIAEIITRSL